MTEQELQKLLDINEVQTTEFKTSSGEKVEICETICAFANTNGGVILVGITPKRISAKLDFTDKSQTDITDLFKEFDPKLNRLVSIEKVAFLSFYVLVVKVKKSDINYHCFKNECYQRIGACNKKLSKEEYFLKRNNHTKIDWSAQICEGATIDDLDLEAIEMARTGYIGKLDDEDAKQEVVNYDVKTFLVESKLLDKNGQISKATMILLGKENSGDFLPECMMEILWEEVNTETNYQKFRMPFIKAITKVLGKMTIRTIEVPTYIAGGLTDKFAKIENYKLKNLRECVANCIAHQDYTQSCKILILESPEKIIFKNAGKSICTESQYLELLKPKNREGGIQEYRNKKLYDVMDKIGLIEGRGSGFRKWFKDTTTRSFLPIPTIDFDAKIGEKDAFSYTVYGFNVNDKFVEILQLKKSHLEIEVIILLDRVAKKLKITTPQFNLLKRQGLVIGKPTNCWLSLDIAKIISGAEAVSKEQKKEDFDKEKCIEKIYKFVKKCNKEQIIVKTKDIFEHIRHELVVKDNDKKNFNYLNNYIIKAMREHLKYRITSSKQSAKSTWLAL